MSQPTTKRPPQVTLAGSVVIAASVFVVLGVWDRVSRLRSLESRDAIERTLETPMWSGTGLDVEGVMRVIHVAGLVAAACAAATGILGWFVMRRDTSARLALALFAVPLFVTGLATSSYASSFVAAAAAMLWLSPAREWFATGRWTPPPPRQARTADQQDRPSVWPPALPPSGGTEGQGSPPEAPAPHGAPYATAPPTVAPPTAAPYDEGHPHPRTPVPPARPPAVVTAVVLSIVMSVLVALVAVLALVLVGTDPEWVLDEMARQQPALAEELTLSLLRYSVYVGGVVFLVPCVLALTFAAFVTLGREWARWGLMVTAAFSAGICVFVVMSVPMAVLPGAAAIATVLLLRRPESRAWCQESRTPRGG